MEYTAILLRSLGISVDRMSVEVDHDILKDVNLGVCTFCLHIARQSDQPGSVSDKVLQSKPVEAPLRNGDRVFLKPDGIPFFMHLPVDLPTGKFDPRFWRVERTWRQKPFLIIQETDRNHKA